MPRSVFDAVSGLLPPAPGRLASRAAATVHALADIRRAPDMLATSAGEFNLDVLAGDNALAPYKADNAATDATSVGHVGERRNFTATSHAGSSARRQTARRLSDSCRSCFRCHRPVQSGAFCPSRCRTSCRGDKPGSVKLSKRMDGWIAPPRPSINARAANSETSPTAPV